MQQPSEFLKSKVISDLEVRSKTPQRGLLRLATKTGGASRDRTDDPLLAKQVLSQLSYGPVTLDARRRSPGYPLAGFWWVWVDLNHRPHPYQGCALTN